MESQRMEHTHKAWCRNAASAQSPWAKSVGATMHE